MAAPQPLQLDWTFRRDTIAYLFAVLLILGACSEERSESARGQERQESRGASVCRRARRRTHSLAGRMTMLTQE